MRIPQDLLDLLEERDLAAEDSYGEEMEDYYEWDGSSIAVESGSR